MDCVHCTLKGDLTKCKKEICGVHNTWYAIKQQRIINELNEAMEWALGYDTSHDVLFEPPKDDKPRYWWRKYLGELRDKALGYKKST